MKNNNFLPEERVIEIKDHLRNIINEFDKEHFYAARNRLIDFEEFWEGDLCEKCGGFARQISKAEAEQPHKGKFDDPIIKCFFCHHEFKPF